MSLFDLASLGSFVSGFAVLISLIFLYFQLRQVGEQVAQAEKNQRASVRQGRADRTTAIAMGAADPGLADAVLKAVTGAPDITTTQQFQFNRYCFAMFNNYEDNFSFVCRHSVFNGKDSALILEESSRSLLTALSRGRPSGSPTRPNSRVAD